MQVRRIARWLAVALLPAVHASTVGAAGARTPLLEAVKRGDTMAVRVLLKQPGWVNVGEADGTTPLHWAASSDDIEALDALLDAGADIEADGLVATLRKHVDVLRRVHRREIDLRIAGTPHLQPRADGEVFRIAQEALQNALRHARAEHVSLSLDASDGSVVLSVTDDGDGFDASDPTVRSRRLGLTSMEERARELGGTFAIDSRPGQGTTVRLAVGGR